MIEGQHYDIRRTLWKYAAMLERQRRLVRDERDALLDGAEQPTRWREARSERYAELVAICGPQEAAALERQATLHRLDEQWASHLQAVADLRETIHVVRLANKDPLQEYLRQTDRAYRAMRERLEDGIVAAFDGMELSADGLRLATRAIRGPSATWTYLVDDNPFRDALGLHVAGSLPMSIGAAIHYPLYMAVALLRRFRRRSRSTGRSGGSGT